MVSVNGYQFGFSLEKPFSCQLSVKTLWTLQEILRPQEVSLPDNRQPITLSRMADSHSIDNLYHQLAH